MSNFTELALRRVLQFVQHCHCDMDVDDFQDMLEIADYLRVESLIKYCVVTLHAYLLSGTISMACTHNLIAHQLQGIDRYLVYSLCDVAVEQGYLPLVKEGLNLGMNPNIVYEDLRKYKTGYNLLFKAVAGGHFDTVQLLLDHGANVNYQIRSPRSLSLLDGRDTPWIENFQAIKQHYMTRTDLYNQCQTARGCTALHIAVWKNHLHIIKLLLERGARIQPDHDGETAIHFAAARGCVDVLKHFSKSISYKLFNIHSNIMGTPLFRAILSQSEDTVRYMVEHGADPKETDYAGFTVVSYAAVSNCLKLTRYLHEELGLSLNEQNDTQETSLHQCASLGHLEVVKYCVTKDPALLHIQDERGEKSHYKLFKRGSLLYEFLF